MGFFLFLLVTAALFVRPGEISAEWYGWPIYQYLILACFAAALPSVVAQLLGRRPADQPITLCVFGLLPLVVLSNLGQPQGAEALDHGFAFLKVLIYYLLLISLVNTPARLQIFLHWLIVCCAALTLVTVLQFHEVIKLPDTFKARVQDNTVDRATNEEVEFDRMQGSGIFQDPNDLCLMLAACVPLCLFALTDPRLGTLRFAWLGPLGLFFYAISLTHSRGGLLALLVGLAAILHKRLGGWKTLAAGAVMLPLVLVFFAGRQTEFSASSGTGQARIQLWQQWLDNFRDAPLSGVGAQVAKEEEGAQPANREEPTHVAHNAYLQSFADMGVLGGFLFVGVFYFAVWSVSRLGTQNTVIVDPELRRAQPFVLGCVVAYAVGMLSLSLNYVVPTYLMLGLAHAYGQMTVAWPPPPPARFGPRVIVRLALISVGFLALTYVVVRVFGAD